MFFFLGNEIHSSACGDDDEDCGSASGGNSNEIPIDRFGKVIVEKSN